MCGIAGIVGEVSTQPLEAMVKEMVHRGPDDEGVYRSNGAALGVRRLCILDPSSLGHQPMSNEDGSIWIAYNGEIYNFQELNEKLRQQGHQIKSNCDTETIIHLYEQYGRGCVHHLRGMFAFAIWEEREQRLFLARDRLGIKPLYYTIQGNCLAFASELKALASSGMVAKEMDPEAIWHYLSFGAIPSPLTIWKNVHALPPGTWLELHQQKVDTATYWRLSWPDAADQRKSTDNREIAVEVRRLLENAIQLHLHSDVPLGAFLSGGVDSTTIVALMSQFTSRPVRTFCVGYDIGRDAFDEREYARIAANHFQTDHTEIVVTVSEVFQELDHFIRYLDQPSHDALNSYLVSKAAATDVRVALSGLGGDELFGGYSTFRYSGLLQRIQRWNKAAPAAIGRAARALDRELPAYYRSQWPLRVAIGAAGADTSISEQIAAIRFFFTDSEKQALFSHQFLASSAVDSWNSINLMRAAEAKLAGQDWFNRLSGLELEFYMSCVLLRDIDAASMAHSLEVRVPFVDQELVELVASLPGKVKYRNYSSPKSLLVECVKDLLPERILNRRKKGFALPMQIWMRDKQFREMIEDCLSERSIRNRGFFNCHAVTAVKNDFFHRRQAHLPGRVWVKIWLLTVLELWCREYLDARG